MRGPQEAPAARTASFSMGKGPTGAVFSAWEQSRRADFTDSHVLYEKFLKCLY